MKGSLKKFVNLSGKIWAGKESLRLFLWRQLRINDVGGAVGGRVSCVCLRGGIELR
jgi:hypothetical protein